MEGDQMLVIRLVFIVGLFRHAVVRNIGPIHSVSVALFHSYGHETNLLFILRPPFEATAFNLIRTREEFVVKEFCYFFAMHPNITKPFRLGVHGFRQPWCCILFNT